MVNPRNPSFSGDGEGTYRGLDPFDPAVAAAFEREKMNQQRGQGLGKRPRGRRFSPNSSERNHSANSQTVAERETEPSRQQQRGQFRSTDACSEDSHLRGENIPEIPVAETKEEKNKRRKTQKAVADKNYREKIRQRAALADKLEPENEELREEIEELRKEKEESRKENASQQAMIEDLRRRLAQQEKKVDDLTENGKNVDDHAKKIGQMEGEDEKVPGRKPRTAC
ncbi:hypothetical protein SLEP1_g41393 [Rubroshorea leprosula]|uniref:BZIP domain-containing protein n=1 Tax=Rubroshorea leprosula TaxID=152421 RepID=A0AAV5L6Y0_9ROSI|nr:hypothetical protein SLEP1_g41393 [Rubroshorea leprosula]